jgi:hypothetical protein
MTKPYSGTIGSAVVAILLASCSSVARAQIDCSTFPVGPSKTDCYINVSRATDGRSDAAAAKARVQSDAATYRQIAGTSPSKAPKARRKRIALPPG